MKKRILIALAAVVLIGCGIGSGSGSTKPVKTADSVSATEAAKDTSASSKTKCSIEEQILFDKDGIKVTAKEMDFGSLMGDGIKIIAENDSDKNVTIQTRNSAVNGCMCDTWFSCDVASGKKATDTITFSNTDFKKCDIKSIAEMEFSLHIFDSENYQSLYNTDQIVIKTDLAGTFEQTVNDEGNVIYDNKGILVKAQHLSEKDSIFGPGLVVYIENNSSDHICIQTRDSSVNGFMCDTIFSEEVLPGKKSIDAITFMDTDLKENGIEEITDLEFSLHIFDNNTYSTIDDTDSISLTF